MYYGKLIDENGNIISYQTSTTPFIYTDRFLPLDNDNVADLIIQEYEQEQEKLRKTIVSDNQSKVIVTPGQIITIVEKDLEIKNEKEELIENEEI